MAISLEQFIERLADSGLMTVDGIGAFTDGLPADQKPADAEALAKQLISAKKLTAFQAQQIWKGKGKHLVLGNYVISDKLGQGGMGMVFKASHKLMKRVVALKVLSPAVIKDKNAVKRFLREVEVAAKLTHPNIVAAHDADQSNGTYFLIMEYVEGRDLSVIVEKQGPAKIEQAVDCILQAARGLEYAHKNGVIHRDIKPANLLLDKSGTVKVLDMGLARIEEDDSPDAATQAGLTGTGTIMGTIDYMSPEQAEDTKRAGPQADIYSLGATLYYLLIGKPVIKGDTLGKKLKVLMTGVGLPDSISSARSGVSPELDALFRKMIAFDAKDRYQSMTELIADLEALKSGNAPQTSTTPGIEPVSAVRGEDSAMQSFLNHLDDGTAVTGPTVQASPKTEAASPETMASSIGDATNPGFQKTTAFTTALKESKNRKLIIGGGVTACLLLGAIIWGFSRGDDKPQASGGRQPTDVVNKDVVNQAKSPPLAVAPINPKSNYALAFDGKDDYVAIPTLKDAFAGPATLEAWVTVEDRPPGIPAAIEVGGLKLRLNQTGRGQWMFIANGTPKTELTSVPEPAKTGSPTHVAGVYDGKHIRLYIDGKLLARWQMPPDFLMKLKQPIGFIGGNDKDPKEAFLGMFHGIRISNTARYADDFTPEKRFTSDEDTLALYHFDECQGDVLKDSSGNNHLGKIHGATWVPVMNAAQSLAPPAAITPFDTGQAKKHKLAWVEHLGLPAR